MFVTAYPRGSVNHITFWGQSRFPTSKKILPHDPVESYEDVLNIPGVYLTDKQFDHPLGKDLVFFDCKTADPTRFPTYPKIQQQKEELPP